MKVTEKFLKSAAQYEADPTAWTRNAERANFLLLMVGTFGLLAIAFGAMTLTPWLWPAFGLGAGALGPFVIGWINPSFLTNHILEHRYLLKLLMLNEHPKWLKLGPHEGKATRITIPLSGSETSLQESMEELMDELEPLHDVRSNDVYITETTIRPEKVVVTYVEATNE